MIENIRPLIIASVNDYIIKEAIIDEAVLSELIAIRYFLNFYKFDHLVLGNEVQRLFLCFYKFVLLIMAVNSQMDGQMNRVL